MAIAPATVGPMTEEVVEGIPFGRRITELAEEDPDAKALIIVAPDGSERVFTTSQIDRRTNQLARAFAGEGVALGDRVAIELQNSPELVLGLLAAWKIGAAPVPMRWDLPDWERQRVRNDDSVVLEVVYRDVALLLTGDISTEVERAILPRLTPSRTRILKVAHHGSRTSSSMDLLTGWRPQIAIISAGRGNTFGHPAPEVLRRLDAIGATVLRTDRDGQITMETDGSQVSVRTFLGRQP